MHCQQRLLTVLHALIGAITNNSERLHLQAAGATSGPIRVFDCADALPKGRPYIWIGLQADNSTCEQPSIYLLSWKENPDENIEIASQYKHHKPHSSSEDELALHIALTVPQITGEFCDVQMSESKTNMATIESSMDHSIYHERSPKEYAAHDVQPAHATPKETLRSSASTFSHTPELSSSASRYHGIVMSLLSIAQNRVSRKFHVSNNPRHRPDLDRRTGYVARRCEDTICDEIDGQIDCSSEGLPDAESNLCDMCYPLKKDDLLKAHCQRQEAKSLRVFYKTCIVLGAFIGGAFLSCLVRWVFKSLQSHYRRMSGVNLTRPASGYDRDFPLEPAISTSTSFGSEPTGTGDGPIQQGSTPASMGIRRVNTFGPVMKSPRRDVRDVFDLASAEATPQSTTRLDNRIPVLPRAPNASVRRR